MKTTTSVFALRTAVLAAIVCGTSILAAANEQIADDAAARLLAANGSVPVKAAGPYVERGTFRIQVSTKLGRPDLVLSDGTWLYFNRTVAGSSAQGTLVVRFEKGRVSDLAVATPAVVAALRGGPTKTPASELVATK